MRLIKVDGCLINVDRILSVVPYDEEDRCDVNFVEGDSGVTLEVSVDEVERAIAAQAPLLLTETV